MFKNGTSLNLPGSYQDKEPRRDKPRWLRATLPPSDYTPQENHTKQAREQPRKSIIDAVNIIKIYLNGTKCLRDISFNEFQDAILYRKNDTLEKTFENMKNDEIVKILMQPVSGINKDELGNNHHLPDIACGLFPLHLAAKYNQDALEKMLAVIPPENLQDLLEGKDLKGRTPLQLAVLNMDTECARLLVEAGADLHTKNNKGRSLFHSARNPKMIDFLNEAFEKKYEDINLSNIYNDQDENGNNVLQHFFKYNKENATYILDKCIYANDDEFTRDADGFLVFLNLSPFIKEPLTKNEELKVEKADETSVIGSLLDGCRHKELLKHPVIRTYILLKHSSIKHLFLASIVMKIAIGIIMSVLTIYVNDNLKTKNNSSSANAVLAICKNVNDMQIGNFMQTSLLSWETFPLFMLALAVVLLRIIWEIPQFLLEKSRYFKSKTNWFHLSFCLFTIVYLAFVAFPCQTIIKVPWFVNYPAAVIVFISLLDITYSGSNMFGQGTYIVALFHIMKKIVAFFMVYLTTFISFAITFHLIMHRDDVFGNFSSSFMKVVAMMVGEIEFGDIFGNLNSKPDFERYIIYLLLIFFLFLVPIAINNLLIGLTVSNTMEILQTADLSLLENNLKHIINAQDSYLKHSFVKKLMACFKHTHLLSDKILKESKVVCLTPNLKWSNILFDEEVTYLYNVDEMSTKANPVEIPFEKIFKIMFIPISLVNEVVEIGQKNNKSENIE